MLRKHNIEIFGILTDNHITIKGNKLNLRWFDDCILVWSDKNNREPLPKKFLEIIEEVIEKDKKSSPNQKLNKEKQF